VVAGSNLLNKDEGERCGSVGLRIGLAPRARDKATVCKCGKLRARGRARSSRECFRKRELSRHTGHTETTSLDSTLDLIDR